MKVVTTLMLTTSQGLESILGAGLNAKCMPPALDSHQPFVVTNLLSLIPVRFQRRLL